MTRDSKSSFTDGPISTWTSMRDRIDLLERSLQRIESVVEKGGEHHAISERLAELEDKFHLAMSSLIEFDDRIYEKSSAPVPSLARAVHEARNDFERVMSRFFRSKNKAAAKASEDTGKKVH